MNAAGCIENVFQHQAVVRSGEGATDSLEQATYMEQLTDKGDFGGTSIY
jgi:hypothetical protein